MLRTSAEKLREEFICYCAYKWQRGMYGKVSPTPRFYVLTVTLYAQNPGFAFSNLKLIRAKHPVFKTLIPPQLCNTYLIFQLSSNLSVHTSHILCARLIIWFNATKLESGIFRGRAQSGNIILCADYTWSDAFDLMYSYTELLIC